VTGHLAQHPRKSNDGPNLITRIASASSLACLLAATWIESLSIVESSSAFFPDDSSQTTNPVGRCRMLKRTSFLHYSCLPTITDDHRRSRYNATVTVSCHVAPDLAPPGAPYPSHRCYCGKHRQKTWERHALTIVGGRVAPLLLHPVVAQPLTTVLLDVRRLNRSTTLR
jgi:hypothetical protein